MKTNYLEIEKTNQKFFYDTVQSEYLKITKKYPVDFSKEFDVRGEIFFNNGLIKGVFWHSNNGSGFGLSSVSYDIHVPPISCYSFQTKKEAEEWLKKYRGRKIVDKSKVKIYREFCGVCDSRTDIVGQLEVEYFNSALEFKETTVEVLKWYGNGN